MRFSDNHFPMDDHYSQIENSLKTSWMAFYKSTINFLRGDAYTYEFKLKLLNLVIDYNEKLVEMLKQIKYNLENEGL